MAAFTANNHRSGFSPSILAQSIEEFASKYKPVVIDLREPISFRKANLSGSSNASQNNLREYMDQLPKDYPILLISDDGQKGHVSARMLKSAGFEQVYNLSGGYISLERQARVSPFAQIEVNLFPVVQKNAADLEAGNANTGGAAKTDTDPQAETSAAEKTGPLIIDVRTRVEFDSGTVPGAISLHTVSARPDGIYKRTERRRAARHDGTGLKN